MPNAHFVEGPLRGKIDTLNNFYKTKRPVKDDIHNY